MQHLSLSAQLEVAFLSLIKDLDLLDVFVAVAVAGVMVVTGLAPAQNNIIFQIGKDYHV